MTEKIPQHVCGGDFEPVTMQHFFRDLQTKLQTIQHWTVQFGGIFMSHKVWVCGARLFSACGIPPSVAALSTALFVSLTEVLKIILDLHINTMQNNLLHPVSRDIF